jgi:DNA-binding SARP family transcriptional activator
VRSLVDKARASDPVRRAELLDEALVLWRGEPLADFRYETFAQEEIARLEEFRLTLLEERAEAKLAIGEHADLVTELEALVRAHPLRERLRTLLWSSVGTASSCRSSSSQSPRIPIGSTSWLS